MDESGVPRAQVRGGARRTPVTALRWTMWAVVASAAIGVLGEVLATWYLEKMWSSGEHELISRRMEQLGLSQAVIGGLAELAVIVGLVMIALRASDRSARVLAWGSAAAAAALAAWSVASYWTSWGWEAQRDADLVRAIWVVSGVATAVHLVGAALAVWLDARARGLDQPAASHVVRTAAFAVVALAWMVWYATMAGLPELALRHRWTWLVLRLIVFYGGPLALAATLASAARGLRFGPTRAPEPGGPDRPGFAGWVRWHGWATAADGLDLYAHGIRLRLWIGLLGAMFGMVAVGARSSGMLELMAVLVPLLSLVSTALALAGVRKYTRVPEASGGRGPALVGFVLLCLAAVAEVYVFVLCLELTSDDARMARDAAEAVPLAQAFGLVFGLAGLFAMLVSLSSVSRAVGATRLRGRVLGVGVLLVVTLVLVLATRSLAERAHGPGDALAVAITLLGVALIALATYLSLLRELAAAMRRSAAR